MAPREAGPARTLKGIEVAGAAQAAGHTPVKLKGAAEWFAGGLSFAFDGCVWGKCCGTGCDCKEGSKTKDKLDKACRAHDVCYAKYGGGLWDCDTICNCDPALSARANKVAIKFCRLNANFFACDKRREMAKMIAATFWGRAAGCGC
ncbi:hypothetical protein COHA_006752 [Chlorella ohadii]|uniref:Phospholipase A2 n=1 Tax=Chlorella ohadii TaxID=2649997 RepID=A0AAD5DK82_9CHLO|nr:hypothetical protein COHA_006752 [Chlorella ohadii]